MDETSGEGHQSAELGPEGGGVMQAALAQIALRQEGLRSLRAARSASKTQEELARELWVAAESGSDARALALMDAGALPSHVEAMGAFKLELGPFERAAIFGNERFLSALAHAGHDPFAHEEGWMELMEAQEEPEMADALSRPKSAAWVERACERPLSAAGARVMTAWAQRFGARMASGSMNGFAWRPATALAAAKEGFGAESYSALLGMLASWERWSQGKDVDDRGPIGLARLLAARAGGPEVAEVDPRAAWAMAVRLRMGPVGAMALAALGEPPLSIDAALACFGHGEGDAPLLLAAIARDAGELCALLAKLPGQAQAATHAQPKTLAWAWSHVGGAKQAKALRALGLSLLELDESATAMGAQPRPLLARHLARALGGEATALATAIGIGRLEPDLWLARAPDGATALDDLLAQAPEEAARVEAKMLGKAAPAGRARGSGATRI